jgi:hypothetical protein
VGCPNMMNEWMDGWMDGCPLTYHHSWADFVHWQVDWHAAAVTQIRFKNLHDFSIQFWLCRLLSYYWGPLRPTFKNKLGDGTVDCALYSSVNSCWWCLLTTRVFCRDNMTPILTDHGQKAFNCMVIDVV